MRSRLAALERQRRALDEKQQMLLEESQREQAERQRLDQQHQQELAALRAELAEARMAPPSQPAPPAVEEPGSAGPQAGGQSPDASAESPAAEPSQPSPVAADAPVSLADTLRRLGMAPPADDNPEEPETPPAAAGGEPSGQSEQSEQPPAERNESPAESEPSRPGRGRSSRAADEEEESIDAYMAKLLARNGASPSAIARNDREQENARPRSTGVVAASVDGPEPAATAATVAEGSAVPAAEPQKLEQIAPRAVAPEWAIDLTAMRELANNQAQSAILRHVRSRAIETATSKLFVAVIAAISAAILFACWHMTQERITLWSAIASSVVAAYWGIRHIGSVFARPRA
jgi:hypothetical protein